MRTRTSPWCVATTVAATLVAAVTMLDVRADALPPSIPVLPGGANSIQCPPLPPQPTAADLAAARACAGLTGSATPPTGTGSSGAGAGAAGAGGGAPGGGPGAGGSAGPVDQNPPQDLLDTLPGPFTVHQTQTLGGESISGYTCAKTQAFVVNFATPKVAFATAFIPTGKGDSGTWTYAYSIQSAGETHSASGSYAVLTDARAHALHLTMTGKDNVAFKGFAGPFPVTYKFDLLSMPGSPCTAAQ
jgi:hypothetical protein